MEKHHLREGVSKSGKAATVPVFIPDDLDAFQELDFVTPVCAPLGRGRGGRIG